MAIAWVHHQGSELFTMFSEVITVDCTSETNNESRVNLKLGGPP